VPAPDLLQHRLRNQHLIAPLLGDPADVVRDLTAVQAQDYRGALWAIAQRTKSATEADVERAIAERKIVRGWPMRGTLHFVAPDDLHWMLRHLAPRVIQGTTGRRRELGLESKALTRAATVVERALSGGGQLTRPEAYQLLAKARISPDGQRGIHILGYLSLSRLICLGPHRGKQPTFVLLDEWLPPAPDLDRDEAFVALARRYYSSHGPATVSDFAWWSGLPLGEARKATSAASSSLAALTFAGTPHFTGGQGRARTTRVPPTAHLLPPYDEYAVAYRDRTAFLDRAHTTRLRRGIFAPVILLDGRIAGTWTRRTTKTAITITAELLTKPGPTARRNLTAAAKRYGQFLGATTTLDIRG
jgi:hypothetical protein